MTKALQMDGGDGCTSTWTYAGPLDRRLKNGYGGTYAGPLDRRLKNGYGGTYAGPLDRMLKNGYGGMYAGPLDRRLKNGYGGMYAGPLDRMLKNGYGGKFYAACFATSRKKQGKSQPGQARSAVVSRLPHSPPPPPGPGAGRSSCSLGSVRWLWHCRSRTA